MTRPARWVRPETVPAGPCRWCRKWTVRIAPTPGGTGRPVNATICATCDEIATTRQPA